MFIFYNRFSKCRPPFAIHNLHLRKKILRSLLNGCRFCLMAVIATWILFLNSRSVLLSRAYTISLKYPQIKKSMGFKSGERAGQWMVPPRPIHLSGYVSFNWFLTRRAKWQVAPSCCSHMRSLKLSGRCLNRPGNSFWIKFK